jgi:hypothetical protein
MGMDAPSAAGTTGRVSNGLSISERRVSFIDGPLVICLTPTPKQNASICRADEFMASMPPRKRAKNELFASHIAAAG